MGEIGIALPNHGREHNLIRKIDPKEDIYSYSPYIKKKHPLIRMPSCAVKQLCRSQHSRSAVVGALSTSNNVHSWE